jgi:hypothetical protein
MSIQPAWQGSKNGEASQPQIQQDSVAIVPQQSNPTNHWHGTTPRMGCKSVKELQPLAFFSLSRIPLSLLRVHISVKSTMIQTNKLGCIVALMDYLD